MGAKAKVLLTILLATSLVLGVWHLSSPPRFPAVGAKYMLDYRYSALGAWTVEELLPRGRAFLVISIANLTFPRTSLSTTYSVVISKVNETITSSPVSGFSLRVSALMLEDNIDGIVTTWGKANALTDAVQVTTLFLFKTSASHELRFTLSYELYELFPVGYWPALSVTRSFNVTQSVL